MSFSATEDPGFKCPQALASWLGSGLSKPEPGPGAGCANGLGLVWLGLARQMAWAEPCPSLSPTGSLMSIPGSENKTSLLYGIRVNNEVITAMSGPVQQHEIFSLKGLKIVHEEVTAGCCGEGVDAAHGDGEEERQAYQLWLQWQRECKEEHKKSQSVIFAMYASAPCPSTVPHPTVPHDVMISEDEGDDGGGDDDDEGEGGWGGSKDSRDAGDGTVSTNAPAAFVFVGLTMDVPKHPSVLVGST
ncbi:hypothetical protein JB92DRAFT_3255970 [Gautieria morchelliformis]|nr:hypothetical protein JB92DRAFT_3255970 [Gautieria morchelliformis]